MKSLCGLSYVVLTFFGAINMKRVLAFLFAVSATLWMAAPAAAWGNLNDSEEPGSVLVFPRFHTGTIATFDQGILPRTRFEVSVTCPVNFDCSGIQTVYLKAHWVCGGNASSVCQEVDFTLNTTINGTITFNPENIGPRTTDVPTPPDCPTPSADPEEGPSGYVIMWVTDASGNPLKFDGLLGDEVIVGSSLSAVAYDAIPIQANPDLQTGSAIGAVGGPLLFDGSMYQEVTGKIYGSIPYESTGRETSLILLTLDVQSNLPNFPTFVGLNFYNENEVLISSATNFTCWGKVELSELPGGSNLRSDISNPFGNKGLVTSTGALQNGSPATLLGVVEREEEFTLPVVGTVTATLSTLGGIFGGSSSCTVSSSNGVSPSCASASCTFGSFCFLPNPIPGERCLITVPTVTCDISTRVTNNLDITREWGYPFLNDSQPLATTFVPF